MIYDLSSSDDQLGVLANCTRWQTAQTTSPTGVARVGEIDRLQFPLILRASGWTHFTHEANSLRRFGRENRVALGDCSPRAPTDPYVRTLAHTVPQIMALLRIEAENASREPEQAGNGEAKNRISSSASSDGRCGD